MPSASVLVPVPASATSGGYFRLPRPVNNSDYPCRVSSTSATLSVVPSASAPAPPALSTTSGCYFPSATATIVAILRRPTTPFWLAVSHPHLHRDRLVRVATSGQPQRRPVPCFASLHNHFCRSVSANISARCAVSYFRWPLPVVTSCVRQRQRPSLPFFAGQQHSFAVSHSVSTRDCSRSLLPVFYCLSTTAITGLRQWSCRTCCYLSGCYA